MSLIVLCFKRRVIVLFSAFVEFVLMFIAAKKTTKQDKQAW